MNINPLVPLNVPPDFDSARGHHQERRLYIDDLRNALWIDENPATYATPSKTSLNDSSQRSSNEENDSPFDCNGRRRRSSGVRRWGGRTWRTPDAGSRWTVSPAASSDSLNKDVKEEPETTPKGAKR